MKGFFIFCSGANREVLEECPTEVTKYVGIGATIFFTAMLAGLSGGYALFTVFRSVWVTCLFGLLWAIMIFNLDRVIISGMRKQASFWWDALYALPRLLLAALLAMVIAKPLELKLFEREIEAQIAQHNNETYQQTVRAVDSAYGALQGLKDQNQKLHQEIRDKQEALDKLYKEWIQEAEGTGGTFIPGKGPVFGEKELRLKEMKRQLDDLEKKNNELILPNEKEISRLEEERKQRIKQAADAREKADGLLARLEALAQLNDASDGMHSANLFITLLFIALETAPISVKLLSTLSPYRPYEQKLEDREFQVVASSKQFREVTQHRLDVKTRNETSEVDDYAKTEMFLNSERNRQRQETELQANMTLMQRIAGAQSEIAERIVEMWKEKEMAKVETNIGDYVS